jgi:ABC-2 type transport system ATP-binding protein
MEYVLTTSDLRKDYKRFQALNNLSMHVPKGAIYGFVGKNGAGKTTLIRLICGLQAVTSGSYSLFGVKHTNKAIFEVQKRIGAIVETPSIYLDLSAEDNLKIQYRILGLPSFSAITELLKMVGLGNTGKKKARNFSLGMRQRLGIAIALANNPDMLILDEPINGLDPQGIIEIRELILKLNRERQITVLISSHILDELNRFATHYGFIDNGIMLKEITAKELLANCRKSIQIDVSNTTTLTPILDRLQVEYEIISNTQANLYGEVPISELTLALAKDNCQLLSIREQNEDLESYYMNLVGGNKYE